VKDLKLVDLAIVGGGFTGLAMAKEISTRTSLRAVLLEQGAISSRGCVATRWSSVVNSLL
jgi:2-polyprenyl-6-methoxyphenol hydroxylase-like FAD-dependent oxidoreductase